MAETPDPPITQAHHPISKGTGVSSRSASVDRSACLRPSVLASADGPVLTGQLIEEAYGMIRPRPHLELRHALPSSLLQMVAATAAPPTPATRTPADQIGTIR
jgi:hypothetical protein